MTNTLKQHFAAVIKLLKYLGMWPTNTINPILYWIYTVCVFLIFQIPMATFPVASLFIEENVGVLRIASCIFLNLQVSIVPFKTIILLTYHKYLLKAVQILDCDSFNSYTEEQKHIVQKDAASVRRIFNYVFLCFITVIIMSLSSLTSLENRELFVEMWFPYNPKANLLNYFSVYLFSVFGVEFCALTNSAVVVLTCGLLIQAGTQLKILKDNLRNRIDQNAAERYHAIIKCIKHYSVIIVFMKLIESSLSLMLSLQFLSCTIVICLSSFLLTVTPVQDVAFFGIVFYLCCILLETFLLCYFGEYLRTESSTISDAIYLSKWWSYDIKSKKALIILMERTKVPLKISPSGMFTLSNATFAKLIQRAYSLFAVLQRMDVVAT